MEDRAGSDEAIDHGGDTFPVSHVVDRLVTPYGLTTVSPFILKFAKIKIKTVSRMRRAHYWD